jgi:hypothetical protein
MYLPYCCDEFLGIFHYILLSLATSFMVNFGYLTMHFLLAHISFFMPYSTNIFISCFKHSTLHLLLHFIPCTLSFNSIQKLECKCLGVL